MGIIPSTNAMLYETNSLGAYFYTNVPSTLNLNYLCWDEPDLAMVTQVTGSRRILRG